MTLADLYAAIPAVDCIPGCTDCCGIIPLPLPEERRAFGLHNIVHDGMWRSRKVSCHHGRGGGCDIHETRPFMCRLFGTVAKEAAAGTPAERMVCPHGRTPKEPLTVERVGELTMAYFELAKEAGHGK